MHLLLHVAKSDGIRVLGLHHPDQINDPLERFRPSKPEM